MSRNPYIPSFKGIPSRSEEELLLIMEMLDDSPYPILTSLASEESDAFGYAAANGQLVKFAVNSGVVITPMREDDTQPYELAFIYNSPVTAWVWTLCRLGYGSNAQAFEKDVLIFRSPKEKRPMRMAFETEVTPHQLSHYRDILSSDTLIEQTSNVLQGSRCEDLWTLT